jgi:N6-L-threonylcarbamoyladenine synthase
VIILGIETSCDETAAAVVRDGVGEICSVVASSKEFHEKTGGVVPEIAARKQVEAITPVISECFKKFKESRGITSVDKCYKLVDAVAVTVGPGLVGSLIVGIEAAKSLSLALGKPLIPVNHLVGHIYANFINNDKPIDFPAIALLVSGGHTDLVLMKGHGDLEYLGGTLDDAAGEAFDKVARLLGLSKYLGGVLLSKKAEECKENILQGALPRPMMDQNNFDFSFSGLKTSTRRLIEENKYPIETIAREFENAAVDVLVNKTIKASKKYNVKNILLGGGVSANRLLRERIEVASEKIGVVTHIPPISLCTDNAVYIAGAAFFNNKHGRYEDLDANPSLGIMDTF